MQEGKTQVYTQTTVVVHSLFMVRTSIVCRVDKDVMAKVYKSGAFVQTQMSDPAVYENWEETCGACTRIVPGDDRIRPTRR
jgi:hypothetical protein